VNPLLTIINLAVTIDGKQLLQNINLSVDPGSVHVLMGPNGSGKSSLAYTIMGHPRYTVTQGSIVFLHTDATPLSPDKRAKLGIFLATQHPTEIEGVPLKDFLRQAYNTLYDGTPQQRNLKEFNASLDQIITQLAIEPKLIQRAINVGFSGGEKKQAEMLQLAVLQPKLAILDEIDSGLDIDALKKVCQTLLRIREQNPDMSLILITHYSNILKYIKPDVIHVMDKGSILRSGGPELLAQLEASGYKK
jgi:Fe-S cluster assembly ATP-binding protein